MSKRKLKFRFSGKMARLLGRESVSSDVAALFELVKNGYDADATKVDIFFKNINSDKKNESVIIVKDNGHGMTSDDVEKKWMVIGTDIKERNEFTKKGRRVVGNKGVGRFSTEKLAHSVTLISKPLSKREKISLDINWDDYEIKDTTFNDVQNLCEIKLTKSNSEDHGMELILTNIRTKWNERKIERLLKAISTLVLPPEIQSMRGDSFNVEIHAEEFGDFKRTKIDSILFDAAPYVVKATLPNNKTSCTPRIYKKGKIVRQDVVEMSEKELENGEFWTPFGKCKVTLYFYPERNKYEKWDEHYKKVLNVSRIAGIIRDFNGVKLYRDGFWVRPYGEEGNDWLGLEASRVQSFLKIGNSRIIGFVEITKDGNPGIVDTTTRERLDENVYLESLKKFVKDVVDELYHYRDEDFRRKREQMAKQKHENVIETEIKFLEEIVEEQHEIPIEDKKEIKNSLKQIHKTFKNFQEDSDEEYTSLEIAERAYRNLASLGISSASTSHEIANLINDFEEIPDSIQNQLEKNKWNDDEIDEDLDDARNFISMLKHYVWFNRSFVQNISDDISEDETVQKIKIKSTINDMFSTFTEILSEDYDIKSNIAPDSLSVWMNKADFMSIVLNLLTNSIKALSDYDENKKRKIKASFYRDSRNFKIKFSDNGKGIKDHNMNKIFRLFFTTNEKGTGLGLPIVQEIVEQYDGKIELSATSELENGATFMISIPWENVSK